MTTRRDDDDVTGSGEATLLLGEWACLGILYPARTHGFAIAARLAPSGDLGRVWSLSRPLTYRSLDRLSAAGCIEAIGEERGIAGGNRTILAITRRGRHRFRRWVTTPVDHLRDLRSELLLKLVLAEQCGIDVTDMLEQQHVIVRQLARTIADQADHADRSDPVLEWRREASDAALRFLDRMRRR